MADSGATSFVSASDLSVDASVLSAEGSGVGDSEAAARIASIDQCTALVERLNATLQSAAPPRVRWSIVWHLTQ